MELTGCSVALVVFKDMCVLKVHFRNISIAGVIALLLRLILKASATWWLSHGNSIKRVIDIFEEIIDSLGATYEKSKDPKIKFVRDALLRHMILFNLLLADLLQTSNNFFKLSRSRTIQFSSLPSKVDRIKERLRKYIGNIETERLFFLNYADDYLHVTDQQSELSSLTWEKGLQNLTTEEWKQNFLQKIAPHSPKISCRNRCSIWKKATSFYVLLKYLMWITLTS